VPSAAVCADEREIPAAVQDADGRSADREMSVNFAGTMRVCLETA